MGENQNVVTGTGVVVGIAYAPAAWTKPRPVPPVQTGELPEEDRPAEVERYKAAAAAVAARLADRASTATGVASNVLGATAKLAADRGLQKAAIKQIKAGKSAEAAATAACDEFVYAFTKVGGLMAERVTDLRDIRDRTIAELMGLPEPGVPSPSSPVVLLGDDLAPADTAGLDPKLIVGIATVFGGPTSHTSIIARQLGIPCIVAASDLASIAEGTPVLVDGAAGTVSTGADPEQAKALVADDFERREKIRTWTGPAQTKDGHPVDLLANVQDGASAEKAADTTKAMGIGLYRTELSFLAAQSEPTVEAQANLYGQVYAAFPGKKVVIRTLDAGSDKPVPFAHQENEENPALGVRGLRLRSIMPGVIERQLDALAVAAKANNVEHPYVMAPMVATVEEAREFAALCRERGLTPGIMVEVPAVALMADKFLAEVDFFSIGTNDLTQYTMAADRMSSPLAKLTDPWQPAVLRLIQLTAAAGQKQNKIVGVCGEAASSPALACVLIGLGVTYLSMASGAIASVGVALESVTMEQCQQAADAAVSASSVQEAKDAAKAVLGF